MPVVGSSSNNKSGRVARARAISTRCFWPPDNSEKLNLGAEYGFHDYLFLRGGYKLNYDTEGLTAGFGVKFPLTVIKSSVARLDYAYQDLKFLSDAHHVSLNVSF